VLFNTKKDYSELCFVLYHKGLLCPIPRRITLNCVLYQKGLRWAVFYNKKDYSVLCHACLILGGSFVEVWLRPKSTDQLIYVAVTSSMLLDRQFDWRKNDCFSTIAFLERKKSRKRKKEHIFNCPTYHNLTQVFLKGSLVQCFSSNLFKYPDPVVSCTFKKT